MLGLVIVSHRTVKTMWVAILVRDKEPATNSSAVGARDMEGETAGRRVQKEGKRGAPHQPQRLFDRRERRGTCSPAERLGRRRGT